MAGVSKCIIFVISALAMNSLIPPSGKDHLEM